jgi:hypothetical protein
MKNLEANRRLAGLLGWTNIVEVAGALLGTPPVGSPESRGQAKVPDWAGDWRECGPLSSEHQIDVRHNKENISLRWSKTCLGEYGLITNIEESRDATTRLAIVYAVGSKLESTK